MGFCYEQIKFILVVYFILSFLFFQILSMSQNNSMSGSLKISIMSRLNRNHQQASNLIYRIYYVSKQKDKDGIQDPSLKIREAGQNGKDSVL
jgi:hypothetical protein